MEGIVDLEYAIPNVQVDYHRARRRTFPVSYWRSVGYSQNTFFTESFLDEMAAPPGKIRSSSAATCWRNRRACWAC